jgi:hypothetical protein
MQSQMTQMGFEHQWCIRKRIWIHPSEFAVSFSVNLCGSVPLWFKATDSISQAALKRAHSDS